MLGALQFPEVTGPRIRCDAVLNRLLFRALLFGAGQFGFGVFGVLLTDSLGQGIATTKAFKHTRGVFNPCTHAFLIGIGDDKKVERAVYLRLAPVAGLSLGRFLDLFSERRPAEVLVFDVDVLRGFADRLQVAFLDVADAVLRLRAQDLAHDGHAVFLFPGAVEVVEQVAEHRALHLAGEVLTGARGA